MLVLVLVVGASVRRVVFSWHDILLDFVHHSVFEVWGRERGGGEEAEDALRDFAYSSLFFFRTYFFYFPR